MSLIYYLQTKPQNAICNFNRGSEAGHALGGLSDWIDTLRIHTSLLPAYF